MGGWVNGWMSGWVDEERGNREWGGGRREE